MRICAARSADQRLLRVPMPPSTSRFEGSQPARLSLLDPVAPIPLRPVTQSARPALQLTERRKGNDAYRSRNYQKALHHYERAQAVVEFVQVGSALRAGCHEPPCSIAIIKCQAAALTALPPCCNALPPFCPAALPGVETA